MGERFKLTGQMCGTCKFWKRQFSENKNGELRPGFVCACHAPADIPTKYPSSIQRQSMAYDKGGGCPAWSAFEKPVFVRLW